MEELEKLTPLEGPEESSPAPSPERSEGGGDPKAQAGYTGPDQRCASCGQYSIETGECAKFKFTCEPDGYCPSWEGADVEAVEGEDNEDEDEAYLPDLEEEDD